MYASHVPIVNAASRPWQPLVFDGSARPVVIDAPAPSEIRVDQAI
jgi:hypothetical protein